LTLVDLSAPPLSKLRTVARDTPAARPRSVRVHPRTVRATQHCTDNQRLKYLENDLNLEAGKETLEGFTRAATRTAGTETPVVIHGKGGTVDELRKEVGRRFDALANGNTLHADPQKGLELNDLRNKYVSIPGAYDDATVKAMHGAADHVMDLMRANGGAVVTGQQYQTLRSRLNSAAMSAEGQKATALHDFVDVLDNGMEGR
jgi:hypothetical protein